VEKAKEAQIKYNLPKACSVEELLRDPDVDIVVNLTIPAAHYEVNMSALRAGKHVYCEKPLALSLSEAKEITDLAEAKSLRVGCAPDTFLGGGIQTCRKLLDEGIIGKPVGFTANLVSPGPENFHPAAHFYYKKGAGPMMDMGPYYLTALVYLLGSIKEVGCFARAGRAQREVNDDLVDVEVFTHYAGIMNMTNGAVGNINMSFDVWRSNLPGIEIYGTEGTLFVPDPNMFEGPVKVFLKKDIIPQIKAGKSFMEKIIAMVGPDSAKHLKVVPLEFPAEKNMRGFGVSDMAQAIMDSRPHRVNGDIAKHVVEAMTAFETCERTDALYQMTTSCDRPMPLPEGLELWAVK
jgi:predicted dehydrogenase